MEKEQIGVQEAGRIFQEKTGLDYIKQSDKFEDFLKTTLAKDTIDLYKDCIKLAGADTINAISKSNDNLRIKLIENYLKLKDTLSQIKIFIPNIEAIKNVGSKPVFEVKFSMEE